MNDSLFQKEQSDQIFVKDISIPNPLPNYLEEIFATDGKSFVAKPYVVLKCLYDGYQSLNAHSGDPIVSYYMVYHRDQKNSPIFLAHIDDPECLTLTSIDQFIPEAQSLIRF